MEPVAISQNERLIASLVNLSAIPAPYLGPLVGLAVGHRSSFVRFHAIRQILDEIALTAASALLFGISLLWTLATVTRDGFRLDHIDWRFLVFKAAAFWLLLQFLALANGLSAVFGAIEAFQGKHPTRSRGLKQLAAKISGLSVP